jgi:MFS family permease
VFSGVLCDRIGKRKLLVGFGYGLGAITKPAFPLASSAAEVLAARFFDRIGKGIRGAPRDALVADITPPEIRGAAYGIRQALDTVGAFAGPLLAIALMAIYANDIRAVFWWAVVPAAAAVSSRDFRGTGARRHQTELSARLADPSRSPRANDQRILVGCRRWHYLHDGPI